MSSRTNNAAYQPIEQPPCLVNNSAKTMIFHLITALLLSFTTAQPKKGHRLPKNYDKNLDLARDILDELFLTSQNTKVDSSIDTVTTVDSKKPKPDLQTGPEAQQSIASSKSNVDPNMQYNGDELIEWINGNGGYIHPNARIGLDPTGKYRGVFVKTVEEGGSAEGIENDDVICRIPWSLLIKPPNYGYNKYFSCESMKELYKQFHLGDKSFYAPYVKYLMNQPRGRIISEWSDEGKDFLSTMLNKVWDEDDEQWVGGLPPKFVKSYEEVWLDWCKGEDNELAKAAFYQFTSRDEDTLMVPFYDMHNHSNDPKKLNTIHTKPRRQGKPFILRATRDIKPGNQIYISYTRCNRCWHDATYKDCTTWSHYSSADIFDLFGFVEDFPQTWAFDIKTTDPNDIWDEVVFCLEHDEDSGTLLVSFGDNYSTNPNEWIPTDGGLNFLHQELARLNKFAEKHRTNKELIATIPEYEWEMCWRYHDALMTSMSAAIVAADIGGPNAETWQPPPEEDSYDEASSGIGEEDEGEYDDSSDDDYEDDDSSDDQEGLVPTLASISDEL